MRGQHTLIRVNTGYHCTHSAESIQATIAHTQPSQYGLPPLHTLIRVDIGFYCTHRCRTTFAPPPMHPSHTLPFHALCIHPKPLHVSPPYTLHIHTTHHIPFTFIRPIRHSSHALHTLRFCSVGQYLRQGRVGMHEARLSDGYKWVRGLHRGVYVPEGICIYVCYVYTCVRGSHENSRSLFPPLSPAPYCSPPTDSTCNSSSSMPSMLSLGVPWPWCSAMQGGA